MRTHSPLECTGGCWGYWEIEEGWDENLDRVCSPYDTRNVRHVMSACSGADGAACLENCGLKASLHLKSP